MTTHYRVCNLCEAMGGLEIRLEDGKITSIRGDAEERKLELAFEAAPPPAPRRRKLLPAENAPSA